MDKITQNIIDHSLEYATELLIDTRQSYPFGAFIDRKGQVHPLEFEIEDKKNIPNNEAVRDGLKKYCEEEIRLGKIVAYGLTYEAIVSLTEGEPDIETIAIDIVNPNEPEIPLYYFPYKFNSAGDLIFGETFAVKR
ncbi:MAG: hypothetical protein P8I80_10605 [Bacteroidales bacterium]|jgi:hypothetical protein|nr:hypothetical protein [Bacteroidales bacterium]MDG2080260.1 hypothetical protein [Bacteroidales bacterium]|tara:strand:- start:137 stop:544 length:408 start_codon:yes stop_codon:yes gene_type:complete